MILRDEDHIIDCNNRTKKRFNAMVKNEKNGLILLPIPREQHLLQTLGRSEMKGQRIHPPVGLTVL